VSEKVSVKEREREKEREKENEIRVPSGDDIKFVAALSLREGDEKKVRKKGRKLIIFIVCSILKVCIQHPIYTR
jgi:hypothetical protein